MTDQQHPITPPPELICKWNEEAATEPMADQRYIAVQAARWGADQELKAGCKALKDIGLPTISDQLHTARRPKSPSLKEQALAALETQFAKEFMESDERDIIRRALEALPD